MLKHFFVFMLIVFFVACSRGDGKKIVKKGSLVEVEQLDAYKHKQAVKKLTMEKPVKGPVKIKGRYHGNAKTKVLHDRECSSYNCPNCTIGFRSLRKAKKAGFKLHTCVRPLKEKRQKRKSLGPIS